MSREGGSTLSLLTPPGAPHCSLSPSVPLHAWLAEADGRLGPVWGTEPRAEARGPSGPGGPSRRLWRRLQ